MTFQTVEQYEAQIASLTAEIERLRALLKEAYEEGYDDADRGYGMHWAGSDTRAALQPKEETQ